MDEVFIRIRGKLHYPWRAVDQHGNVLDLLMQSRRSARAAKREILPGVEHRLTYRAEVSHQPTRRRERQMQRFKSARHAQGFLSTHSRNHFQLCRHCQTANQHRLAPIE